MPNLTFWTARLYYSAVTPDVDEDLDIAPQDFGITSSVEIKPFLRYEPPPDREDPTPVNIRASTLTPTPAMLAIATVRCRLDAGWLMLRVDPDKDVDSFPDLASFPVTGVANQLYRSVATDKVYEWSGSIYVEVDPFTPVRLVSQTDVLGLPEDAILGYEFSFSNSIYGGKEQALPSFCVQAPTTDVVLDLAVAPRIFKTD